MLGTKGQAGSAIEADGGFGHEHRIVDCFLGRFDGGQEEGIEAWVWSRNDDWGGRDMSVGRRYRKGDGVIAGAVGHERAGPCEAHNRASGEPFKIALAQWGVRGDDDHARSFIVSWFPGREGGRSNGPTFDHELTTVVALYQNTYRVSRVTGRQHPRCCANAAFES